MEDLSWKDIPHRALYTISSAVEEEELNEHRYLLLDKKEMRLYTAVHTVYTNRQLSVRIMYKIGLFV
jgi:hypothetical protein